MGLFFSNLHIRASESVSADTVQEALTELLKKQGYQPAASADKADITLFLCDKCGQWISVCSDAMDFDFTMDLTPFSFTSAFPCPIGCRQISC